MGAEDAERGCGGKCSLSLHESVKLQAVAMAIDVGQGAQAPCEDMLI